MYEIVLLYCYSLGVSTLVTTQPVAVLICLSLILCIRWGGLHSMSAFSLPLLLFLTCADVNSSVSLMLCMLTAAVEQVVDCLDEMECLTQPGRVDNSLVNQLLNDNRLLSILEVC